MKIKFIFAWYDFYVGWYWNIKKKWLYIFPIPMFGVVLKFDWKGKDKIIPHWKSREWWDR